MKYIDKLQNGNKVPFIEKVKNVPENKSQIDKNSKTIINLYQRALKKGLSRPQVLGLLGNIAVETMGSFDPDQKQLGGGPGRGLIQMEVGTTRYKDFLSKVKNPNNLNEQFDYILDTMFDQSTPNLLNVWGGYGRQDKWVKNPNLPVSTSTKLLSDLYFRPGKPNIEERQKAANYIGEKLNRLSIENFIPKFPKFKKGGWIQKAINPKHKGYCTPMTKSTCTPHRKALARRFKSGEFKKHQQGGVLATNSFRKDAMVGLKFNKQWYNNPETIKKLQKNIGPRKTKEVLTEYNKVTNDPHYLQTNVNVGGYAYASPSYIEYRIPFLFPKQHTPNIQFTTAAVEEYSKNPKDKYFGSQVVKTTAVHENAHTFHQIENNVQGNTDKDWSGIYPNLSKIQGKTYNIPIPKGATKGEINNYYNPTEAYARLQEVRMANNLKPTDILTDKHIKNAVSMGINIDKYPKELIKKMHKELAYSEPNRVNSSPIYVKEGGVIDYNVSKILEQWKK